ncbi:MAG: accessory gene regulator B family protein [Syntrophomonadaceae bacterium]|jgi:accessory gene regulator B|nr:accessory gene regulator B family protein [Syntrophomonadaceae bacterium]
MIKHLSWKIASHLGQNLQTSPAEVEVYAYGLESLFNNLLELLLLFLLAWATDLLLPCFLVLTAFALIRVPGGGAHLSTFPRCLTASLLVMLSMAKLSEMISWPASAALALILVLTGMGLGIIKAWVPAGTEKKMVTAPEEIKQQKRITTGTLLVGSMAALGLVYSGYLEQANAMILGSLCGLFVITPWGYKLFHILDQGIDRLERRCAV